MKKILLLVGSCAILSFTANAEKAVMHEQDQVSNPNGGKPCCRDIVTTTYYHYDNMHNQIIDGWDVVMTVDCDGSKMVIHAQPEVVLYDNPDRPTRVTSVQFTSADPADGMEFLSGTSEIDELNIELFNDALDAIK